MAITIHKQPPFLAPTYNPMIIAVTSSNQTLDNFQFVGDIYADGTLVTKMRVPVNPDGYGVFDIHRHVENQISYDFNPEWYDWNVATESYATYSVQFSEEFRFEWQFYDFVFDGGDVAFLGLSGGDEPLFNVGDQIFITGDAALPTEYNGIATINDIQQAGPTPPDYNWVYWLVTINKPFTSAGPVGTGGTMSLANFSLNTVSVTASTKEQYAWNGVYSFLDFINYDYTTLVPDSSTNGQFITTMPNNWKVGTQSRVKFLTFRDDYNDQKNLVIQSNTGTFRIAADSYTYGSSIPINTWTDNGGNLQVNTSGAHGFSLGDIVEIVGAPYTYDGIWEVISVPSTTQVVVNTSYVGATLNGGETIKEITGGLLDENIMRMVGVGPYELLTYTSSITVTSGSLPVIDSDTSTYSVWTEDIDGNQDLETKVFTIKDWCSRFEQFQLIFQDKKGSFIPYTFNKVNRDSRKIERSNYQQYYGQYAPASQNWNYNTYDRGTKNLDTVVTQTFTVNSDWVNQTESDYLMELFESPEVYWIKEDGTTVAITITDTSVERKQTINDQIINYTLTFNLSNKNMMQKG